MKSLLLLALGLARTVVLGARIEAERIVVSVRPYKREQRRCPVCGRACDFYDMANRGAPRLWRAMDLARSACYLEYAPCRVRCPEHGVRTEAVPWARHGARFTRDFEDWVAWLAVRCTASAVSELARVEWHGVGGACRRVYAELEAAVSVNIIFTNSATFFLPVSPTHPRRIRQRTFTVSGYSPAPSSTPISAAPTSLRR